MTQLKQLLGQIASEHLLIPTLETRKSDILDFHTVSVWGVEAALHAAYQAGRKSSQSDDIDIDAVLARKKQIAVIWSIDDVQEVRPDLTEKQAWDVLQRIERRHDASIGITWDTLEMIAQDLFGAAPESDEV